MTLMPCQRLHCRFLAIAGLFALVPTLPGAAQTLTAVDRAASATASRTRSTSEIAALATPATVTILTFDEAGDTLGQGSGFLVRSSGVIVTNWHVMAGASAATVLLASGERFDRVEALDGDRAADLAVVKVPGYGLPTLTPVATVPAVGAKVVAIGSPHGLARTVTEGIVSASRMIDGRELVQMSAAISPGSSGGPVLDAEGRVFAVATSQISDGQQLNFARPVRYALGLISATPSTRPLAALFATERTDPLRSRADARPSMPASEASPGTVADFLTAPVGVRPGRAGQPRSSLRGTYVIRQEVRWPDLPRSGLDTFHVTTFGLVVLAADHSGFVLRTMATEPEQPSWVQPLAAINVAGDGRIAFRLDGRDYAGYQSDDGMFAEASDVDSDGDARQMRMRFRPTSTNLAHANGLYGAAVRTRYRSARGGLGDWTDWTGDLAVVTSNDSIWVDVTLVNQVGGSTGAFLVGALNDDGRFALYNPRRTFSLVGRVAAGILSAEWTDVRKDGSTFSGMLRANRE
jgi:hypothetical protein